MSKRVTSGEPLRISAADYNAVLEAAERSRRAAAPAASMPADPRPAAIVHVRNDSGTDAERGGVLGIDGPIVTRSDGEDAFLGRVALIGVTPTVKHIGQYVVLLEPISTGHYGRACVSGACVVQVAITDEAHRYAMPEVDDMVKLKSAPAGTARLVYIEPIEDREEEGIAWCVALIGSGDVRARRGRIVTEGPPLVPEGEPQPDFTDHRYWVKFGVCTNTVATEAMTVEDETDAETVMVTNLGEHIGETHYLHDGQIVDVWLERDETTDPGEHRYYIVHPP